MLGGKEGMGGRRERATIGRTGRDRRSKGKDSIFLGGQEWIDMRREG